MSRLEKLCKGGVFLAAGDDYRKSRRVLLGVPLIYHILPRRNTGRPWAIRTASYCLEEYSIFPAKISGMCALMPETCRRPAARKRVSG